jgi:hypothetical protein
MRHDEMAYASESGGDFLEALPFESFFPGRKFPIDESRIAIGEINDGMVDSATLTIRYGERILEEVTIENELGEPSTRTQYRLLKKSEDKNLFNEIIPVLVVSKNNKIIFQPPLTSRLPRRIDTAAALLPCAAVPTRFASYDELADIWDKVGLTDAKSIVFDTLRIIAPDFQDLMFIKKNEPSQVSGRIMSSGRIPIVRLANIEQPIPLNSMGDGMARVLQLALKMLAAKGGILLIDEFENGLHYSVQEKVWEIMFTFAKTLDIQIFATTHSWDCIESFAKVASQREAGDGELFKVGRSIRTSDHGKIIATVFDGQKLFDLTQADMEVR